MRSLIKLPKLNKLLVPNQRMAFSSEEAAAKPLQHSINQLNQSYETENMMSIQFTLNESPGVLNKAVAILTNNQINMKRIASKPSKFVQNNWREVDFFIDIEGTTQDENV
jgi:prephenate dehydratase